MITTRLKIDEDVQMLKSDVRRLREDVVGLLRGARSRSKDMIMGTGDRIRGIMADLGGRAKGQVHGTSQALKDRGHNAVESWRGGIEHRPMTSLLVAFAAGAILALLMTHKRY